MKKSSIALTLAAGVALAALSTGCPPPPPGRVYVRLAPPVPVVDVVGVAPGPEFVWIPGYHRWEADRYVWVSGHWDRPPRPGVRWVPGHWRHERGGWFWVEGHWR